MLINFSVENFLSFNQQQTFSMKSGKARKHAKRIFKYKNAKLVKCSILFGANASGKSNLISAFRFVQNIILEGLPKGFSNKYFRQNPENQDKPSFFEIEILLNDKHLVYGFSILLKNGSLQKEYLYEVSPSNIKRYLYKRNLLNESFEIGDYFKDRSSVEKLKIYGGDSTADTETLFLSIMNSGKLKMYEENPELRIFRDIFIWFDKNVDISNPMSVLMGSPSFSTSNLEEIAELLNALGTGISGLRIVDVPAETIKEKVPRHIYEDILLNLEKRKSYNDNHVKSIGTLRSYKQLYIFELNENGNLIAQTIEFSHENESIHFELSEESDGTARILDLIDILLRGSENQIFVIDEIDRYLHPTLTVKIIQLFLELAESRNIQLIATSHESRLLAIDLLRNDEICFIVKDKTGASILNPLEKYQLRADKKVYTALFDGTLEDVLPSYDDEKLHKILERPKNNEV